MGVTWPQAGNFVVAGRRGLISVSRDYVAAHREISWPAAATGKRQMMLSCFVQNVGYATGLRFVVSEP